MASDIRRVKTNGNSGSTNFLISIHYFENNSWQGTIEWLDTGKKLHFRSELELLNLMNQAVQETHKDNEESRNWDDSIVLHSAK